MSQERRLDAFFFTLEIPCEERLSRLVEEYNALADRWSEEHEALAQAEREKAALAEALQRIAHRNPGAARAYKRKPDPNMDRWYDGDPACGIPTDLGSAQKIARYALEGLARAALAKEDGEG